MSEYQCVAFQAVDRSLTDKELKFAEQQSTRAEISRCTCSGSAPRWMTRPSNERSLNRPRGVVLPRLSKSSARSWSTSVSIRYSCWPLQRDRRMHPNSRLVTNNAMNG
jgi:hypothetical protein